jgi:hypothetical protein
MAKADSDSVPVLTHERFARAPVENGRHQGRYPKSVVRLSVVRRSRHDEEESIRAWGREHANAFWTFDQIRRAKRWSEAEDLLERRNDDIWQEVKQLQQEAAALLHEASRLQCLLVKRQLGEQFGQGDHDGQ